MPNPGRWGVAARASNRGCIMKKTIVRKPLLAGMIVTGCLMAVWSMAIILRIAPKFF
jgi:hypothetical protein